MNNDLSSYFEDPEFKEALEKYEGMVKNHTPAYFDADELTDIAEYYASKGRQIEAEAAIDFALQLHPNDTDALIFRARSLAMKGRLDEAYMVMDLIEDRSDREVRFLKADLLMEEKRMEEADHVFEELAAYEEGKLETLIDIILAYIDANQEALAKKWIKHVGETYDLASLSQKSQKFRDLLCDFYITFNNPEAAIPLLQATLDRYPYSINHWNSLGKCYLSTNDYEEAHEAIDFALAIDDSNAEALTLKAFCYQQSGELQKSCDYYLRLAEQQENKTRAYLALAKTYFEMQDYTSSIYYIEALLDNKDALSKYELSELYGDIALCHAALKHIGVGQASIRRSLELNENDPDTLIVAGRFFLMEAKACNDETAKAENQAKGELYCRQALNLIMEDERLDYLFTIGAACFDTQNFKLAAQYYEQINREFPDNAPATYFFLAYCYFYLEEAISCMHYIAKMKHELPDAYSNLGTSDSILSDTRFNELMRNLKDSVNNGKVDLDNFL